MLDRASKIGAEKGALEKGALDREFLEQAVAAKPNTAATLASNLLRHLDFHNLSQTNGGRAESDVRDIEITIWPECHRSG